VFVDNNHTFVSVTPLSLSPVYDYKQLMSASPLVPSSAEAHLVQTVSNEIPNNKLRRSSPTIADSGDA